MADTIVSTIVESVVSFAIDGTADFLNEKATFLCGVRGKVLLLQTELKRMQCLLKDADSKQEQDHRVRNYIAEIRDLAYDVEDTIDTFLLQVASRRDGASGFVKRVSSSITKPYHLYQVGAQIDVIRKKIDNISGSLTTYGIKSIDEREGSSATSEMQRRMRRSYPHYEEDVIVGLETSTIDLMAQLMTEDDQLRVVSVVGMGGLGKTTLAKKVYNHIDVKRHFDCLAWAFISQQFSAADVLLRILTEVAHDKAKKVLQMVANEAASNNDHRSIERRKEELLVEKLFKVLEVKRYLVVLDDIWSKEAWDSLRYAFPRGRKGSKVVFTTRIKTVAIYADPCSSPIEPPILTDEEGWTLLSKKALPRETHDMQNFSPEFENIGKQMVKRCGGLPLAILVLGGLLVTKKSVNDWKAVQRNINAQFINSQAAIGGDYEGVHGILGLSFLDLPFHLKPCFLYLSQYPEDWEIQKRDLVQMWIAEGFVSQLSSGEGDGNIQDVGEEYLGELISRSMIQVSKWDHTGKGVKTCRLHDLMRDLCVRKAREENFLCVIELKDDVVVSNTSSSILLSRRIAVPFHADTQSDESFLSSWDSVLADLAVGNSHLRSLLEERKNYGMKKSQQICVFKNFRLLRVLKLNFWLFEVPKEIGYLIHLRYLALLGSFHKLPKSIGNLRSLRTFKAHSMQVISVPNVVWKLERLRHLLFDDQPPVSDFRIETLTHLETLKGVKPATLIRGDALHKLTNIWKLYITFAAREEVEMLLNSPIIRLGRLHALSMSFPMNTEVFFPNLQPISHCHGLTKLQLDGRIQSVDSLGFLPASLPKLSLFRSKLEKDPMPVLKKLPNLRILHLSSAAYEGSQMVCSAGGFPRLEILELYHLPNLEDWGLEEGTMPCLKALHISYLPKLKMIPEALKSITTIQELNLLMPKAFIKRIEVVDGVEGEDFHKVKHIPSITLQAWN